MKLTRERKIFIALGAVAGAALLIDRVLLGGGVSDPHVSEAALPSMGAADHPAAVVAPQTTSIESPKIELPDVPLEDEHSLARRLDRLAESQQLNLEQVGDAFKPSEAWVGPSIPQTSTTTAPAPKPRATLVDRFIATYRLTAVLAGGVGGGVAMVAGPNQTAPIRLGQVLDGFKLVKIEAHSVTFEYDGQTAVLRIRDDNSSGGRLVSP